MKRRLLLSLLFAALFSLPASAFAYNWSYTCGAKWTSLPVSYWINENGSADIGFNRVETMMQESFDEWAKPCCSNFAANYRGTTTQTALNNQGRVVLSWTEDAWDPAIGNVNVVIGVTFTSVYNNCSFASAPILFNGVGFRFSDGPGGTDLGSIAVHEIGHLLGLNHEPGIQSATMFPSYVGGTGARTLHQDDIDGVCSLYTRSCSCFSSSECASGEQCVNQRCVETPCQTDSECDDGLVCRTGDCIIPPCGSDADCGSGQTCENEICVSTCPVCRTGCETSDDCGGNAACVDDGAGGGICYIFCQNGSACPGDAQCIRWSDNSGNAYDICSAPGEPDTPCPSGYVCQDTQITDECSNDSECGSGEVCNNTVNGLRCQDAASACDGINCPEGTTCDAGVCVDDSTGVNNTTGPNNGTGENNGAGENNGTGAGGNNNTGAGASDDPVIIIFGETDDGEEQTCSTAPAGSTPGSLLLLLGLFGFSRRRRQRNA